MTAEVKAVKSTGGSKNTIYSAYDGHVRYFPHHMTAEVKAVKSTGGSKNTMTGVFSFSVNKISTYNSEAAEKKWRTAPYW
jgi:hypothetical protein